MGRILPPVIRVFISSTFADMNNERQYFNTVIAPQLTRLCAQRGVSFFSVDLRWGITEEDQISGNVIPICLREIDNCRPFFIGIIGNRYGSILKNIRLGDSFSWVNEQIGKSVTELEMLYGVLRQSESGDIPNCAFYFRSDELSKEIMPEIESDDKMQKLAALKKTIRSNPSIPSFDYNSVEDFGHWVIYAVSAWLDKEFPSQQSVHDVRRKWYDNELLRDYIEFKDVHEFFDSYCGSSARSLMISGKGQRGKTTALTAWMPSNGSKILINCGADEKYQYWPAIAAEIILGLHGIDEDIGFPKYDAPASFFFALRESVQKMNDKTDGHGVNIFVTDYERESFRSGFISWLKSAKTKAPVYIIINDLNLIDDDSAAYLNWLPSETGGNIHIICSANNDTLIDNAQILGWNVKEMPTLPIKDAGIFLDSYMRIFGKNMSALQKENLLKSPLMQYPGYVKYIIRYFNNYGNFENLNDLTAEIGRMTSAKDLYAFTLNKILDGLSGNESESARTALYILSVTSLGLYENVLHDIVQEISPIDAIGWSRIRVILEQFQLITSDTWKIRGDDLCGIVQQFDTDRNRIHCMLGRYFLGCVDRSTASTASSIKYSTDCAKSALYHFGEAEDWNTLSELLQDNIILYYLTKMEWNIVRSSWMKLLIFSDMDVSSKIMNVFEKCDNEYANIEGIKRKFIGLMSDLELEEILNATSKKSGLPVFSELRSVNMRQFSHKTAQIYNRFVDMNERRQFNRFLAEISAFLEENEDKLNDVEKCNFYFLKLDCERQLGQIEQGLETSYKFYASAIASMNNYEILRAVRFRGGFLYLSGRYTEAHRCLLYSQKFALNLGAFRDYLSSLNIIGMCLYRQNRFSDSVTAFEKCIHVWKRISDNWEIISCWANKCHALYLSGDLRGAINESEKLVDFVDSLNKEEYAIPLAKALGNLGLYYSKLDQPENAATAYLRSIEITKKTALDNELSNNYMGLIALYRKHNQLTKAFELCEEYISRLHRNGMYNKLAQAVKECVYLMQMSNYSDMAEAFKSKWQNVFALVPGGRYLFRNAFFEASDPLLEEQLREELTVARSEKNSGKCGTILQKLASLAKSRREDTACDLYIQAMESFLQSGEQNASYECMCQAMRLLISSGTEDLRFSKVYSLFTPLDKTIIDEWLKLRKSSISDEAYAEGITRILGHSEKHQLIAEYCMLDEISGILRKLPEEIISSIGKWMKDDLHYDEFEKAARDVIGKQKAASELNYLRRNYKGSHAEKMLAVFEKYTAFLEAVDSEDAGALAGNLALIYRRRMDNEQTISHHEKAIRIYRAHKKMRDVYIELMNLATAYRDFGLPEQAAGLLRNTLKEPELLSFRDIHASIAGNLASTLVAFHNSKIDEECAKEIAECFSIEEKYFEESGEMRELAISLINQAAYYVKHRKQDKNIINGKISKLEQIVETYHLDEFEDTLRGLKTIVKHEPEPSAPACKAKIPGKSTRFCVQ